MDVPKFLKYHRRRVKMDAGLIQLQKKYAPRLPGRRVLEFNLYTVSPNLPAGSLVRVPLVDRWSITGFLPAENLWNTGWACLLWLATFVRKGTRLGSRTSSCK